MPDPLLFAVGLVVTGAVVLAVWSVGLIDTDEDPYRASAEPGPRREEVRRG